MGKKYVNQTALDLIVDTGIDLTGASILLIKFIKPDKTTSGSFTALQVSGEPGIIKYSVSSPDDIDQVGTWKFWSHVTFADGTYAAGEVYSEKIYEEGK